MGVCCPSRCIDTPKEILSNFKCLNSSTCDNTTVVINWENSEDKNTDLASFLTGKIKNGN